MQSQGVLLLAEKRVAAALFRRVLSPEIAQSVMAGLYTNEVTYPLFADDDEDDIEDKSGDDSLPFLSKLPNVDDAKWLRFEVSGLIDEFYTRLKYPSFTIRLVRRNGEVIDRPRNHCGHAQTVLDTRVRLSVYNKWADVTREVLSMVLPPTRVLVDGELFVDDWVFHDISHKHGGFFQVTIRPIDFASEILEWTSPRIFIHSDKVLPKTIKDPTLCSRTPKAN
eukprot:c11355_g1_i1.p1 GENE.c11355_g1_i1~~c11355_g1_i1.p1  ORF type:complete len:223 (+),score=24.88 c11355_g1_i1:33-701(+)